MAAELASHVAQLASPGGRASMHFAAHMAEQGISPANLYEAQRAAGQLGKGIFVAAVQLEGLGSAELPVGTKACQAHLQLVAPSSRERVAQHLPSCVRSDFAFLEHRRNDGDLLFLLRHFFHISRQQLKIHLKSKKRVALLLLLVHPTNGIRDMHLKAFDKEEPFAPPILTGSLGRTVLARLQQLWERSADLTAGSGLDSEEAEAARRQELVRSHLERAFKASLANPDHTVPAEAQTPAAPSAAAAAASSASVATPNPPGEPSSAETATTASRLDVEIAESNLAARRKKETAKRGHKKLQPALTGAQTHAGSPAPRPGLSDDGKPKPKAGSALDKPRHPKKVMDKKGPGPSEFELEREMSKLRALAQQHMTAAPPLHISEPSLPAPARRRKAPQGDAKLARRIAAASLLE